MTGTTFRRTLLATPAGTMLAVTRDDAVVVLCFGGAVAQAARLLQRVFGVSLDEMSHAPMPAVAFALDAYFLGGDDRPLQALAVSPQGTDFRRAVWSALREVPRGRTVTYGELAARLGMPGKARAVGQAVGGNLLHLVVPCHRVLPASGGSGGFNAGIDVKEALLALERPL